MVSIIRWQEKPPDKEDGSMDQSVATQPAFSSQTHPVEVIGIDLGDRWSRFCALDAAGNVKEEGRVQTTSMGFAAAFGTLPRTRIVIEVGAHSPWISRLLQAEGHEVIVANPRKVRAIYQSDRKNDQLDARMLARLGRVDVNLLSPVEHRSSEVQNDLALIRSRNALVSARTQLINTARGMVKSTGGRLPKSTTAAFAGKVGMLIPVELKATLTPLLRSIQGLTEQIDRYDERVEQLADRKYPETRLLRQVKGVGPLIALTYVLTIEDPGRFRRSRQVGSFLGLRPRQSESGESAPQLGISKSGNNHLRWLLVQAAHYTLSRLAPDSRLRRWGLELARRGGKNAKRRAVVAVARKLAVLLHRLWVTGEVYDPFYGLAEKTA
jgi:transposase